MKHYASKVIKAAEAVDAVRKEIYKKDEFGHSSGDDLLAAYNARNKSRPSMENDYASTIDTREKRVKVAVNKALTKKGK